MSPRPVRARPRIARTLLATAATEFERALQRNLKGLEYFTTAGPQLGASPKDVLIERGTMRLYHYRPLVDDVYRVPLLLVSYDLLVRGTWVGAWLNGRRHEPVLLRRRRRGRGRAPADAAAG